MKKSDNEHRFKQFYYLKSTEKLSHSCVLLKYHNSEWNGFENSKRSQADAEQGEKLTQILHRHRYVSHITYVDNFKPDVIADGNLFKTASDRETISKLILKRA